jgi:hypothetical protein
VHGISARAGRLDEVRRDQSLDPPAHFGRRLAGHGDRVVDGELRLGCEREPAEHPAGRAGQRRVRDVEGGLDGGGLVTVQRELGQPVAHRELGGVVRDCPLWMVGEIGRGDPQGQRQVATQPGEVADRPRFAVGAGIAEHQPDQADRLPGAQRSEREPDPALARHQSGQAVAAGHQRRAVRPAGEQRADVVGVARVVQHDQQAPGVRQRAVEADPRTQLRRRLTGRYAQGRQQEQQRVGRTDRRAGGRTEQVHEELAAGVVARRSVRPVRCQCRLAHAGRSDDQREPVPLALPGAPLVQPVELVELVVPAGQLGDAGG